MSSGVGVNSKCLDSFQQLKLGHTLKFIVFGLSSDNTEIVPLKTAEAAEATDYETFLEEFPEGECRWAVYDFAYQLEDGGKRNKLVFYSWTPDDAKIKQKMLFAASKDALRRSLVGIHAEIQGTEFSEIAYETVRDKVSRGGH